MKILTIFQKSKLLIAIISVLLVCYNLKKAVYFGKTIDRAIGGVVVIVFITSSLLYGIYSRLDSSSA